MITNPARARRPVRLPLVRGLRTLTIGMTAVAMAGCTHLAVVPDRSVSAAPGMALSGAPYALPMLQYDLAVTRTLTACPEQVEISGDAADRRFWRGAVAVELAVTAKPTQIAGERYLVNYSKLDGALKTTNFAIEYQPGTDILKGVNVSVEDHSGEVAGNIVKTGLAIAAVATGPAGAVAIGSGVAALSGMTRGNKSNFEKALDPALKMRLNALIEAQPSKDGLKAFEVALQKARDEQDKLRAKLIAIIAASSSSKQIMTCTAAAEIDVKARAGIADTLEADTAKLKAANAAIEMLTKLAAVRGLTTETRTALGQAAGQMLTLSTAVEKSQASLAALDKRLALANKGAWPASFAEHSTRDLVAVSSDQQDKFAKLLTQTPVTVRMIDAEKLAGLLAASSKEDLKQFRTIAKDFIDSYVDEDGRAKRFTSPSAAAGCSSDAAARLDAKTCMASLTTLSAMLKPVASDFLPDCPVGAPECRSVLAAAAQRARAAFPRQVPGRETTPKPGLFVRIPVRAQLTICRATPGEAAPTPACSATAKNFVDDDKVLAPQLGQLRFFRLVNQMFSNNGLSLSLSKEGMIEKFQYASSKSIAQSIAAASADAATQVAAFDKQRREEYLKNSDETTRLQKQIALKEAQNKLDGLLADPTPDPMKAIAIAKAQAEVELLRAQINALNAQTTGLSATPVAP